MSNSIAQWSVQSGTDGRDEQVFYVMGRIDNHTWVQAQCDNESEAEEIVEALTLASAVSSFVRRSKQ